MSTQMRVTELPTTSSITSANAASATTTSGWVRPKACRTSDAFHDGFGKTTDPPARLTPCWAMIHSGRLLTKSATREFDPRPSRPSACANALPQLSSSRYM